MTVEPSPVDPQRYNTWCAIERVTFVHAIQWPGKGPVESLTEDDWGYVVFLSGDKAGCMLFAAADYNFVIVPCSNICCIEGNHEHWAYADPPYEDDFSERVGGAPDKAPQSAPTQRQAPGQATQDPHGPEYVSSLQYLKLLNKQAFRAKPEPQR